MIPGKPASYASSSLYDPSKPTLLPSNIPNFGTSTFPVAPTVPSVISSRQAEQQAAAAQADYQKLQAQQVAAQQAKAAETAAATATAPAPEKPKPTEPLVLASQQPDGSFFQQTFYNAKASDVQSLLSLGWQVVSGTLPEGAGTTTSPQKVQQQEAVNTEYQGLVSELDKLRTTASEASKAYIDSIKGIYESRRRQTEDLTRRDLGSLQTFGISSGAYQRSASFGGMLTERERQGIARLTELDVEEKGLIAEAQRAYIDQDFQLLSKKIDLYNTNQERKEKQFAEIQKLALEENKKAQEAATKSSRQAAIVGIVKQGVTSPTEIFDLVNFDESGRQVGDITYEEIVAITDKLQPKKTATGEYGEYLDLKGAGEIPETMGYFDYLKKKKGATTVTAKAGEGIVGGPVTGIVARDADTIMAGGAQIEDFPTKDNYRGAVASELARRREIAREAGDVLGVIRASAGGKATTATFDQAFEKAVSVIGQISDLQAIFASDGTLSDGTNVDLAPIEAIWRSRNPWDTKAQSIKAQLSAIVPNLARGIYGEVGVLTDNDIKVYSRTLPSLGSTQEVRNAVLGLTIRSIQRNIENKIRVNANKDLVHLEDVYLEVKAKADELLAPLEAAGLKAELDNVNLATPATSTAPPEDFWGKAN